jgi:ABC-type glycerol-3-phosphate transport system substrate-binding protein
MVAHMETNRRDPHGPAVVEAPDFGRRRFTRRGALALGAASAGLAALGPAVPARAAAPAYTAGALHRTLAVDIYSYRPQPGVKEPQMMWRRYEHLHPGVKLNWVPGSSGDEIPWIITRALANRLPDIFEPSSIADVMSTIPRGWWVDLTPYLDKPNPYVPGNKRWRDLIHPGLLAEGAYYDGRNFLFEADGANNVFYYNKDLFHKVGVTVPTTWAELMGISQKIKRAGYYAFSMPNGGSLAWPATELSWILESQLWANEFKQPGSTYAMSVTDFLRAVKRHKYSKTDPRTSEAWQLLKRWMPTWYPGTLSNTDFRPFISGKVAIWYDGSWDMNALLGALGHKFAVDIMPIPPVTTATSRYASGDTSTGSGNFAAGNPLAVSVGAQRAGRLPLAIDFLQYYSAPGVMGPMAREQGLTPMVQGAAPPAGLGEKVVRWYINRPCLLGPAGDQMPAEYFSKQASLCTGYLAGSLDLHSALSQLQGVTEQLVDQVISTAHVTI